MNNGTLNTGNPNNSVMTNGNIHQNAQSKIILANNG